MLNKFVIGIILIIVAYSVFAENPCGVMTPRGGDEDWGFGCYLMPDEFRINVYDDMDGSKFGELYSENSHIYLIDVNNKKINIEYEDVEYIGSYRNELVKVKKCFNHLYVNVLWKTSDKNLYISKENLEVEKAKFKKYKDILFDKKLKEKYVNYDLNIGININKSCLNLRENPNTNSSIILCMKGNDWDNNFGTGVRIQEVKGNWAKIEYFEMHSNNDTIEDDDDCSYIEKNNKVGWVKAIADNGFPNIWFAVSGY